MPTPTPKQTPTPTPMASYIVTYDANGGSGAPASQWKGTTSIKLSTARPTRANYEFLGWATTRTATTAQYQPGSVYNKNAILNLYAVWRAIKF